MFKQFFKKNKKPFGQVEPLKYVFINNSILLTSETLEKNGYFIVWQQQVGENKQILTFNEEKQDFKAFDKFIYMDENASYLDYKITEHIFYLNECDEMGRVKTYCRGKDLWTPIDFKNLTLKQVKYLLNFIN